MHKTQDTRQNKFRMQSTRDRYTHCSRRSFCNGQAGPIVRYPKDAWFEPSGVPLHRCNTFYSWRQHFPMYQESPQVVCSNDSTIQSVHSSQGSMMLIITTNFFFEHNDFFFFLIPLLIFILLLFVVVIVMVLVLLYSCGVVLLCCCAVVLLCCCVVMC
jgi:hypothetical protein